MDPRAWQIGSQTVLLTVGLLTLDFALLPWQAPVTIGAALATQWACSRAWRLPRFDPRSALITGLSLSLLLRVSDLWVAALGAAVAIASKFVLTVPEAGSPGGSPGRRKHVWNPSLFGIVAMVLTGHAWVSPGQWGSVTWLVFLFSCLGGLVIRGTHRADITYAFVGFWVALVFGRSLYLGDPWSIPAHQLQTGSLLLFTFFMFSDPRTAPDARPARVAFAGVVALLGWWLQFWRFEMNGLLWSLAALSPLVPVLDRLVRAPTFHWARPAPVPPLPAPPIHPVSAANPARLVLESR